MAVPPTLFEEGFHIQLTQDQGLSHRSLQVPDGLIMNNHYEGRTSPRSRSSSHTTNLRRYGRDTSHDSIWADPSHHGMRSGTSVPVE